MNGVCGPARDHHVCRFERVLNRVDKLLAARQVPVPPDRVTEAFERGGERLYPARVLARVAQKQRCHPTPPWEASLLRRSARPFNFLLLSLLDSDSPYIACDAGFDCL